MSGLAAIALGFLIWFGLSELGSKIRDGLVQAAKIKAESAEKIELERRQSGHDKAA